MMIKKDGLLEFDFTDDVVSRIFNRIEEGVYLIDNDRIITYWNRGAEKITGYSAEEVVGKSCADNILNHIDDRGKELCGDRCPLIKVRDTGREEAALVFLHHKDGARIPIRVHGIPVKDRGGRVTGVLEIFSDTSEVRLTRRKADSLNEELYTDPLTNVGNRRFFDKELDRFFGVFRDSKTPFAAVMCDLDDFKDINDTYGHDFGDRVLAMAAGTLSEALREGDRVCRWGGEEFMILIAAIPGEDELFSLVERIRILLSESFLYSGERKVRVTASFGAALASPGESKESLFKRVDQLLYRSKREGKNRVSAG